MKTVIALDIGTTHIKAMLFGEDGSMLAEERALTPIEQTEEGSLYRCEVLWNIARRQLLVLTEKAQGTCIGISLTGMAEAGLVINRRTGLEESHIIPWFDKRTIGLSSQVSAEEDERNFKSTGLRNSFKYGIYKFLWLLEHKSIDQEQAVWLSVCDYIMYKLTGELVTEQSFAARTYVYDIVKGCWDRKRIQEYGLTESNFPQVAASGQAAGIWQEKGIPVAVAGHDHICASFGLLLNNENAVCDSAGTSETYIGRLKELGDGLQKESGMLYGPFVDGGWFFMANIPSSGHSVEWFRRKLQDKTITYEQMNEKLLALERKPTGILYYPYLTGMGSPYYDAGCEGALLGLKEEHDCYLVLKGIMEGIQYQAAWLLADFKKKHGDVTDINHIICAGGAVHNQALMQLKADISGSPVLIPKVREATLAGAAALYIKRQVGERALEKFGEKAFSIEQEYVPDERLHKQYNSILTHKFLPVIKMLRKINSWQESERDEYDKSRESDESFKGR